MNSALNKFLQLATEAGLLTTIASVDLDSQFNSYEDSRDMVERIKFVPEQASEVQLQDPNTFSTAHISQNFKKSYFFSSYFKTN